MMTVALRFPMAECRWTSLLAILLGGFLPSLLIAQDLPKVTNRLEATQYAESAVADPVATSASAKRAAAISFVQNDHPTHVLLCSRLLQQMTGNHNANAHEITVQYMISAAAFLYGHPKAGSDMNAQNVAGLNAAATVYERFLQLDPKSRFKFMDNVAKQQSSGTLKDFVSKTCK